MGRFLIKLCMVLTMLSAGAVHADDAPAMLTGKGAVVADEGGEVLLTIDLSRPVGWRLRVVDAPPRVVVELNDVEISVEPTVQSTSVLGLEQIQTAPNVTEFQLVIREPLSILSAEMATEEDGSAQLAVHLKPTTADVFQADLEADGDAAVAAERFVIAIDPGHGGRDPGAEAGDIREADLVLEFGKRLRDILLASGRFEVVMTRTEDIFLSLDARLSRARAADADVFLSLHADALSNADAASGIVLYRLARQSRSAANQRLQERHSPEEQLTGLDLSVVSEDVTLSLLDLARQQTTPRTRELSTALLTAFEGVDLVVNSRPERVESFAVLKAADIPSLLIELGFISTKEDLKRLTSEGWQTIAAEAIRDGLILWMDEDRLR